MWHLGAWLIGLCILTSGCAGKSGSAETAAWQDSKLPEWGCQVSLPGTPRKETDAGKQTKLILNTGDVIFLASASEVPSGSEGPKRAETLFDAARQKFLTNNRGTMTEEKRLTLANRYPGRELLLQTGDGDFRRVRMYLAPGRYYVLTVQGSRKATTSKDAEQFLGSLRLLPDK